MKFIFIRHGKDDDRYRGGWSNLDLIDEEYEEASRLSSYLLKEKNNLNIKNNDQNISEKIIKDKS